MSNSPLVSPVAMVPRRYYSSPVHILLALAIITLIGINAYFVSINHHSLPAAVYDSSERTKAEDYILKPGTSLQGWVENAFDPQFWENFADEIKKAKSDEVLSDLRDTLKKQFSDQFLKELRETITREKTEEYTEVLKANIEHDYSMELARSAVKSYSVFEEFKQDYLEKHASEIKDELLTELKAEDSSTYNSRLDRKSYYNYILRELLMLKGPQSGAIMKEEKGDGVPPMHVKYIRKPALSEEVLMNGNINLNYAKAKDLSETHDMIVQSIYPMEAPPFVRGDGVFLYSGNTFDSSIAQALLTIKQIRNSGSKLPIEVVFPYDDLDSDVCTLLKEKYDAKCMSIQKEIGSELFTELDARKTYWKPIGLLVSSFDNIISIDAENIPLKNVDDLLSLREFLTTKWLFWPHHWSRATSPIYYKIANFIQGETIRRDCAPNDKSFKDILEDDKLRCFHDLEGVPPALTAETSQMVFSKKAHYRGFLLSMYYNIHGPTHYYPLLYQNDPTFTSLKLPFNKPDRDTYIPALHVFNEPYHLMSYLPRSIEAADSSDEVAFLQSDPIEIRKFYDQWVSWLRSKGIDTRVSPFQDNDFTNEKYSKFLSDYETTVRKPQGNDGSKIETIVKKLALPSAFFVQLDKDFTVGGNERVLGRLKTYKSSELDYEGNDEIKSPDSVKDWELEFSKLMKEISCDILKNDKYWKHSSKDAATVCKDSDTFIEFLEKNK